MILPMVKPEAVSASVANNDQFTRTNNRTQKQLLSSLHIHISYAGENKMITQSFLGPLSKSMCVIGSLVIMCAAYAISSDSTKTHRGKDMSVADLNWMVGHWRGEAFGGVGEEIWCPQSAGTMVGTFKLFSGDTVDFYEIMVISQDSAELSLKLKHFNNDLTGWEEKDKVITFPFVDASDNHVQFGGLTYKLVSEDSLQIVVTIKSTEGKSNQEIINCYRIK